MDLRITCLAMCLLISACSSDVRDAKSIVEKSLVTNKGLEFQDVVAYPGGSVCGSFSGTVTYLKGREQQVPFIVVQNNLIRSPSEMDWDIYCDENPAAVLSERTRIGPFSIDNTELVKVTRDYTDLADALESYYRDTFQYPTTEQGLVALKTRPSDLMKRAVYRDGGYIENIPLDPWGRPYLYEHVRWGRTKGHFTIITLGSSGTTGGEGPEADIDSKYLDYLQHAFRALGD